MSKKKTEDSPQPVYVGPMASSSHRAVRETIESIVIAFILAFLFRTFEAEAFVIPTGSMAPTLHGMHKDVECPQCGITYRVGASKESDEEASRHGGRGIPVDDGMCPQCGFTRHDLGTASTYGGDRILVNKFAYQLGEPERWDVIVFRFPGDAKMNYIKRLIGLPGETIEIFGGDIFTCPNPVDGAPMTIARKSHRKLRAMLQHVDDNHYIPKLLNDAGWPRRWKVDPENPPGVLEEKLGETAFSVEGREGVRLSQRWTSNGSHPEQAAWIHFRNYIATSVPEQLSDANRRRGNPTDWKRALQYHETGQQNLKWTPDESIDIGPVEDFYAYNTDNLENLRRVNPRYWVGDLAVQCEVEIEEARGELILALEEGGYQFRAMFDLEGGGATLEIENHAAADALVPFGEDGHGAKQAQAEHALAAGKHELMFANCDDKLYVWIDGEPLEFDAPTEYAPLDNREDTDDDRVPAHIGMRGFQGSIDHIRLLRDVYYTPLRNDNSQAGPRPIPVRRDQYDNTSLVFQTGGDQFFTLGDNSPASQDGRIWNADIAGTPLVVDRRLLIGKALFIYWPYGQLLPRWPLFERMKLIR